MPAISRLIVLTAALALAAGCGQPPQTPQAPTAKEKGVDEKAIALNLAQLGADKEAAEAQRFCAIHPKERLGSMGVPVKIAVQDDTIFLCCKACLPEAEKDLEATAKRARALVIDTSIDQLPAEDRPLARSQRFCASDGTSPLGSMGAPKKILIKGQPVFLCCAGCEKECRKDEDKSLALVQKLKAANAPKK